MKDILILFLWTVTFVRFLISPEISRADIEISQFVFNSIVPGKGIDHVIICGIRAKVYWTVLTIVSIENLVRDFPELARTLDVTLTRRCYLYFPGCRLKWLGAIPNAGTVTLFPLIHMIVLFMLTYDSRKFWRETRLGIRSLLIYFFCARKLTTPERIYSKMIGGVVSGCFNFRGCWE